MLGADRADLLTGSDWHSPSDSRGEVLIGFTRDRETDELRAARPGDMEADSVVVSLPVSKTARRLLSALPAWSEGED